MSRMMWSLIKGHWTLSYVASKGGMMPRRPSKRSKGGVQHSMMHRGEATPYITSSFSGFGAVFLFMAEC